MRLDRALDTVQRHLERCGPKGWAARIPDARSRRGQRIAWPTMLGALWAGAVTACRNLRAVERLSARHSRPISDTTLHRALGALPVPALRALMRDQVLEAMHAKALTPRLPFHLIAIDGKSVCVSAAAKHPAAQPSRGKQLTFNVRVLRAAAVSSDVRMVIGQHVVPADQNESSAFDAFFAQLLTDYGRSGLLDVISVDAGYTCRRIAEHIDASGRGYVMALKGTQPELMREARRLLGERPDAQADAATPWESYRGARVRRVLFRSREIAGFHGWTHLREVWRVVQQTERDGQVQLEERWFLTNLPPGRTADDLPLHVVRAHWLIENGPNWTLDTQWHEDASPWSQAAIEAVSLMRLMAYNIVARMRARTFRSEAARNLPWQHLLEWVGDVLRERGRRWVEALISAPQEVVAASR